MSLYDDVVITDMGFGSGVGSSATDSSANPSSSGNGTQPGDAKTENPSDIGKINSS